MVRAVKKLPDWLELIILAVIPATYTTFFSNILFIVYIHEIPNPHYTLHTATENVVWTSS